LFKFLLVIFLSVSAMFMSGCAGPSGPKYQDVRSYSEGVAAVKAPNGRWGFINNNQQWVIQPRFEEAKDFQSGKAAVKLNGKWGFINKRGDWLS
jgi:hypothetical protein